ncbi:serpin family protein [Actinomadura sp. DC4]|uniref:serpin family protein n=1 Tax=Actinomadura sp. DC4 TaxID=3055069 RepID=UPI0025B029DC|nr:serpin family protein [Actinomadura sp. DC4]MDN3356992.1 serpin family protein [Actinomadura sp. DC4]
MYEFALNLHRRLASEGDLVWSPYSVASALGLVAAGARGRTYDELARALGAAPGELGLAEAAALGEAEIAVANTLWLREGLPIEEAYDRAVRAFPGAAVHNADFAGDAERVRQTINAEVAKATRELIRDLLPGGSVDEFTTAVIVNALYLKAAWLHTFAERGTVPAPFHAPGGRRRVPTMRRTGRMPYAEAGGWRMVTLAAAGGVVADVLLGPDGGELSPGLLRQLYGAARSVKVDLSLPRFRVESQASLSAPLGALGVATAFTDDADFSGMTPRPVRIDRVEHKAVLDVDERGFEGAAATAVMMVPAGMDMSRPVEFHADRPFLVVVRHPATEAVYFLARITEP